MEYSDYILLAMNMMRHAYRYYQLDDPEISDELYDIGYKRLQEYEEGNPKHTSSFSPTMYVGFDITKLGYEGDDDDIRSTQCFTDPRP